MSLCSVYCHRLTKALYDLAGIFTKIRSIFRSGKGNAVFWTDLICTAIRGMTAQVQYTSNFSPVRSAFPSLLRENGTARDAVVSVKASYEKNAGKSALNDD